MSTLWIRSGLRSIQVLLFILSLHPVSYGQCIIRGNLQDGETKEPLSGATLILKPSGMGTVTDLWGKFAFERLEPGKYILEINHMGYHDLFRKVTVTGGETIQMELQLFSEIKILEGIEVTGQFPGDSSSVKLPYIRSIVLKNQTIQSSCTDIGTFIRSVPNVSGIRKGGSSIDPVVRGFKYGQLNIQVDNGQKIEGGCPNRMDPALAHIEIEDIEAIEILKGPYALRFGPTFGGVLNLQTQKPVPGDRFEVNGSALIGYTSNPSGIREHLVLSGGNRYIYFGLSGNNKQNGNYKDGNGNWVEAENGKYNIKGQLGIAPGKHHNILLSYNYTMGRNILFPALPMDLRTDETQLMSLDYTWDFSSPNPVPIIVKLFRSDVSHMMDNKNRPNSDTVVAVTTVRAINTGARIEGGFRSGSHSFLAGIDLEHITKDGDRVKTLIMQPSMPSYNEQIWNNAVISNLGLFSEYRRSFAPVDIIVSARLDFNQANSGDITFEKMGMVIYFNGDNKSAFTNLSVSAGAEYQFNEHISFNFMMGRGIRSPDMIERFITLLPIGYDYYDYLGNPSLRPEANNQIDLTCRFSDSKIGSLEVNGFYSFVTNYITGQIVPPVEQKPATSGVRGVKRFYNADLARFNGFELLYGSSASLKWYIQFMAAYTRATIDEAVRHTINANGQVSGTEVIKNDPLAEIPPFESTLVLGYKFIHGKLIPKVKGRFVAHQYYVSQAFYEQNTPGFFVTGFSCSYYHNEHFTITGGVDNVFDNAYYEHLNRRIIGSYEDFYEPGRNVYINLIFSI